MSRWQTGTPKFYIKFTYKNNYNYIYSFVCIIHSISFAPSRCTHWGRNAGDIELKKSGARPAAENHKDQQDETNKRFLVALRELDDAWVSIFQETGFSDIYFSRLFTELWLRGESAVPKTDAYGLVKGLSPQTAMKYIRRAIEEGYLEEIENPADRRSQLLRMTPLLKSRMADVINRASPAFQAAFRIS